jgi:hypothetical protein
MQAHKPLVSLLLLIDEQKEVAPTFFKAQLFHSLDECSSTLPNRTGVSVAGLMVPRKEWFMA